MCNNINIYILEWIILNLKKYVNAIKQKKSLLLHRDFCFTLTTQQVNHYGYLIDMRSQPL